MDIKDILLFSTGGSPCTVQMSIAARLAHLHGARITGVCLPPEPVLPICDSYAIGRDAVVAVLADRERVIKDETAPLEAELRRAAAKHGCSVDWCVAGAEETAEVLTLRARVADLTIVRRPEPRNHAAFNVAATLVLTSGTPCLVVPDMAADSADFDRVILAWNGSRDAKRALDDSLGQLKRASAVEVLIVGAEPALGAGASPAAVLAHLGRHGVHAELKQVREPREGAGDAILQRCRSFRADLLVMGAYGHSRAAEAVFGGATRTVLSHAPIPVLMSH